MRLHQPHNPEGIFSVTMAFVCRDKDSVQADDLAYGRGTLMLDHWTVSRVIPDLHTIFEGASTSSRTSSRCLEKMSMMVKGVRTLLDDRARKDALLQTWGRRRYSSDPEQHVR